MVKLLPILTFSDAQFNWSISTATPIKREGIPILSPLNGVNIVIRVLFNKWITNLTTTAPPRDISGPFYTYFHESSSIIRQPSSSSLMQPLPKLTAASSATLLLRHYLFPSPQSLSYWTATNRGIRSRPETHLRHLRGDIDCFRRHRQRIASSSG